MGGREGEGGNGKVTSTHDSVATGWMSEYRGTTYSTLGERDPTPGMGSPRRAATQAQVEATTELRL